MHGKTVCRQKNVIGRLFALLKKISHTKIQRHKNIFVEQEHSSVSVFFNRKAREAIPWSRNNGFKAELLPKDVLDV